MESQNLHHSSLDLESHTYVHACPLACSKPVQAIFPSCAIYVYIRICIDVHVHELQDKKACCEQPDLYLEPKWLRCQKRFQNHELDQNSMLVVVLYTFVCARIARKDIFLTLFVVV